jgi:hypothetical protein
MAQTGYTPIKNYYSITGGNTPSVGNLSLGEIAINLADQKVYSLNAAGTSVITLVGTLGNQNSNNVSITGGSINGTTIGASTASTGAFTTISASGVITSTIATGTAPFTVASTTPVTNLSIGGSAPAGSLTGTTLASNVVTSSLTTVGTIATGTWHGTTIGTAYGGTGLNGSTPFTANGILYASSTSALATSSAFTFNGTNLVFGTNGTNGILFGASTQLNDYEEGTWTPGVGNLTVVGTFSSSGTYTKIGRFVTCQATLSATTSITGNAGQFFTGLPFTPARQYSGSAIWANRGGGGFTEAYTNGYVFTSGFGTYSTIYVTVTFETT